jgi:hypothetical protein
MAHAPVRQLLLEPVPGLLDALARGLQVVDADARVAEAAVRLDVAVVDLVLGVVLGAVVVRQLDEALAVPHVAAARRGLGRVVAEEVEVELGVGELELLDEGQAQEGVELDCARGEFAGSWVVDGENLRRGRLRTGLLGVLDSDPGVGLVSV